MATTFNTTGLSNKERQAAEDQFYAQHAGWNFPTSKGPLLNVAISAGLLLGLVLAVVAVL